MAWSPRSPLESIDGIIWLPRMLDKARRVGEFGAGHEVDGYLYGDNDFVDSRVLRILRTNDRVVSELVKSHADDGTIVDILVERSGRTREAIRASLARVRRRLLDFSVLEADEGRMSPGLKRSFLRMVYGGIILPIAYARFRSDERKRASKG